MRVKNTMSYLISLTVSVVLALGIGAFLMYVTGHDPLEGYAALIQGAFGSKRGWGNTLYKTGQLAITGLATAVASSSGVFNVGGEGQMYLGALASCWIATLLTGISPLIAIPVCLLCAIAAGSLYALIPAVLKVKLQISEVITTILMNSIAIFFCSYMAKGPLKTTEARVSVGTAKLDSAFQFDKLIPGSNLTQTIFWIAAAALIVWYIMSRTTLGFEMKMSGHNERFARFSGIKAGKMAIVGMLISGALCGMLGMFECFGLQSRFKPDFSNEFYFDGMLVAMIMRYQPLGIVLMSFFFGALKMGAIKMQSDTAIPSELILIIQSIIIFFMAAEEGLMAGLRVRMASRRVNAGKEAQ